MATGRSRGNKAKKDEIPPLLLMMEEIERKESERAAADATGREATQPVENPARHVENSAGAVEKPAKPVENSPATPVAAAPAAAAANAAPAAPPAAQTPPAPKQIRRERMRYVKASDISVPEHLRRIMKIPPRQSHLGHKEEREYFLRVKEQIVKFETTNRQFIVIYQRDEGWWQMGDNSRMIYENLAISSLKKDVPRVLLDSDFGKVKWRQGCIAIRKPEVLRRDLVEILDFLEIHDGPEVKVFALAHPLSPSVLETWENAEAEKEKLFNSIVMPKNIYPKYLSLCEALYRDVIGKVGKLAPAEQKYIGDQGAKIVHALMVNAIRMAKGKLEPRETFSTAARELEELMDWLIIMRRLNLLPMRVCLRMGQELKDLRSTTLAEIRAIDKRTRRQLEAKS